MRLDLPNKVVKFLRKNPGIEFTTREIALWVFKNYPAECQEKKERSIASVIPLDSDDALVSQLIAEIQPKSIQKKDSAITIIKDGSLVKYRYGNSLDNEEGDSIEKDSPPTSAPEYASVETSKDANAGFSGEANIKEDDLYPILKEYLMLKFKIVSMRIDERRSQNSRGSGGNKWLYPDVVGMEDLSQGWQREIKDCVQEYADKKAKLWSFEVKISITRSNVRESFFQTVSNSSWANFGYLVASELKDNASKELRMLCSLHGIGFIKLDVKKLSDSQIIIPAREKPDIDWDSANRLARENPNFVHYIKQVITFCKTGEIYNSAWNA